MPPRFEFSSRLLQRGVTLVELMVAGVILGVAITGVMSILGTSRNLALDKVLNQQAMILATNTLEDTSYSAKKYPLPVTTQGAAVNLLTDTTHSILARLILSILPPTSVIWKDEVGNISIPVPYQTLQVIVFWTVPGATVVDTLFLRKAISPL